MFVICVFVCCFWCLFSLFSAFVVCLFDFACWFLLLFGLIC